MFGHKDDDKNDQQAPAENVSVAEEHTEAVVSPEEGQEQAEPATLADEPATDAPADDSWQHPGAPVDETPEPASEPATPVDGVTPPPGYQPPSEPVATVSSDDSDVSSPDDLVDVRQKALSDLSPLIDHLEHQTPEEKFQVTMMMIQANDDRKLIPAAYEAAKQISVEKARAQALLDIVQEINYFTQHPAE